VIQTPTFALNTDDVPSSPNQVSGPSGRLTLQHFHNRPPFSAPPNQDARPPDHLTNWPPSVITNFLYAYAALKKCGSENSRAFLWKESRDLYNEDDASSRGGMSQGREQQRQQRERRRQARDDRYRVREQARLNALSAGNERTHEGRNPGTTSQKELQELEMADIMNWVALLWSRNANRRETSQQLQQRRD
jgi:hypothetical protein